MHAEAYDWVRQHVGNPATVLDIGGRDINGSCRPLFPQTDYTVLDIRPGANVEIVADAATWVPERQFDLVLCTEVFEHTESWPQICVTAYAACRVGGRFIATMAGPGRTPHSAIDGGWTLAPSEYYGNVHPETLRIELEAAGFVDMIIDVRASPADVRCVAWKRKDDGQYGGIC
jgi:hypothetical protein